MRSIDDFITVSLHASQMRIAILEPDREQAAFVCQTLRECGHSSHAFHSGKLLAKQLHHQTFDLLVLDWNVPDMSGEKMLESIGANLLENIPILVTTSTTNETDIELILNAGADDYMAKPVTPRILLARVNSLLRRAYRTHRISAKEIFDHIEFDLGSNTVMVSGNPVALMQKQFELALLFFQNLSRPLSRSYIIESVWRQSSEITSRKIDTHVSMLRAKLGLRPEYGYRISPIYGYGYRLEKIEKWSS